MRVLVVLTSLPLFALSAAEVRIKQAIIVPKHDYFVGEPIWFTARLHKTRRTAITLDNVPVCLPGKNSSVSIIVSDARNRPVPSLSRLAGCRTGGGGNDGMTVVAPHEELDTEILLNLYVPLASPGTYTVTARRELHISVHAKGRPESASTYINNATERRFTIHLRRDPAALRQYLQHLKQDLDEGEPLGKARSEAYALQYLKLIRWPFRLPVIEP